MNVNVFDEINNLCADAVRAGLHPVGIRLSRTAYDLMQLDRRHATAFTVTPPPHMAPQCHGLPVTFEASPGELAKMENTEECEIAVADYITICVVASTSESDVYSWREGVWACYGRLQYFDWVPPKTTWASRLVDIWRAVWS